jgi:HEAT repeat protein
MRLSEEIRELLQQGRETELRERAIVEPRLVRPLLARLYDPDDEVRDRAARVLGHAVASHPELGREVTRRLVWALNDESATNGVYGIPALGQIGRLAPHLVAPHVSALARMAWDHGLRLAILEALAEVAQSSPELVAPELDAIEPHVDASHPGELEAWRNLRNAVSGDETHEC